ncbi:hypothetical protein RI367_004418 [Sorochytrium milnesiophthora]
MTRDRLGELQTTLPRFNSMELAVVGNPENMTAFLDKVTTADTGIKKVNESLLYIDQLHRRGLDAVTDEQGKRALQDLDHATSNTRQMLTHVTAQLQQLDHDLVTHLPNTTATDQAVCSAQLRNLKRKAAETLREYQDMEARYAAKQRAQLERQIRIVQPHATQADIDQLLESGDLSKVFAQEMVQSSRMQDAAQALQQVQSRSDELRRIEQTIADLAQMFADVSQMIEQQGLQVDQTVVHIDNTATQLQKGTTAIDGAITHRRSSIKVQPINLGP